MPGSAAAQPRFRAGDLKQAAILLVLFPVSLLPERLWRVKCVALAAVTARPWFAHARALRERLPPQLAARASISPEAFIRRQESRHLEEYVQVLRGWTWRWRPRIGLTGREYLDATLAKGNGAILWVSGFESSDLVVKMALADAGCDVTHLSRPTHGFSSSRFGIRFLNPIKKRVEDRYLAARIVIDGSSAVGALRALQRELAANHLVSITVSDAAAETVAVPILGGTLAVATGPAALALRTGAALIPVFSWREASGARSVALGAPLPGEDLAALLHAYGERLDAALTAHPDQWTGWRTGSFRAS